MTKFERWEMFHSAYNYATKYYVNYKTDVLKDILRAMRLLKNPSANGIATAICHELRKRKGEMKNV